MTPDATLDALYDTIDDLMLDGRFSAVDSILADHVTHWSITILLGLLTVTLPAKSPLPSREAVYDRAKQIVKMSGRCDSTILVGLS